MVEYSKIESSDGSTRVVDYIDLFDEGRFGADKLFLRGSFATFEEVAKQVNAFVNSAKPGTSIWSDPKVARKISDENRLDNPTKKFWGNPDLTKTEENPWPCKADYRLLFFMKIHFHNDFGYIWFGLPWTEDNTPPLGGNIDEEGEYATSKLKIKDFKVLKHCWISREDAEYVLNFIKGTDDSVDTAMYNALESISGQQIS